MVLDHVYGKPSTTWKRFEAILVAIVSLKLLKAYHHKPPPKPIRRFNRILSKYAPWQIVLGTLTSGYLISKFSLFTFMNSAEPYARYYNRNYYRATWILTALDAGFWTAMNIKPKFIRDTLSIIFTLFYLIFANRADYKVRRMRTTPTLKMIRTAWEVNQHPLIYQLSRFKQPRIKLRGKSTYLPRSPTSFGYNPSDPNSTTTRIVLYFNGNLSDLSHVRTIILHFPGGGFVSMSPEVHEDYLVEWAYRSPYTLVVAVDYGKAPEYPYPYAHHELFDLYTLIRETNGECLGLVGWYSDITVTTISNNNSSPIENTTRIRRDPIRLTLSGDSAGGNLATGVVTRAIDNNVLLPDALCLMYPHLSFDFACWLSPQQQTLLRVESAKHLNCHVDIHRTTSPSSNFTTPTKPNSTRIVSPSPYGQSQMDSTNMTEISAPITSSLTIEDDKPLSRTRSFLELASSTLSALRTQKPVSVFDDYASPVTAHDHETSHRIITQPQPKSMNTLSDNDDNNNNGLTMSNSLTMTSVIGYFNDRVLTPELMRALALLYAAPSKVPIDLEHDYYLSPSRTPDHILAQFPKTYLICGEKDPLVDDTIMFAGLLRQAKRKAWLRSTARSVGILCPNDSDICEVIIMEGVSHAVLQLMSILPEGRDCANLVHTWLHNTLYPGNSGIAAEKLNQLYQTIPLNNQKNNQSFKLSYDNDSPTIPNIYLQSSSSISSKSSSSPPRISVNRYNSSHRYVNSDTALSSSSLDEESEESDEEGNGPISMKIKRNNNNNNNTVPTSPTKSLRLDITKSLNIPQLNNNKSSLSSTSSSSLSSSSTTSSSSPIINQSKRIDNNHNNNNELLELRDNSHVAHHLLLARRSMQMTHGLFNESDTYNNNKSRHTTNNTNQSSDSITSMSIKSRDDDE